MTHEQAFLGSVLMMRCTILTSCFTGPAYASGIPGAEVVPSAGMYAPRYSEGASVDDPRTGFIPVDDEATCFAAVYTLGKTLRFNLAALRAFLTCPARINRDGPPTSVFCFIGEKEQEQPPSGIRYGLGESAASQAPEVQRLKTDKIEAFNQFPALPMSKILALSRNAFVNTGDAARGFVPVPAALAASRETALGAFLFSLGNAQEARVINLLAVAECGERLHPYIDADALPNGNLGRRRLPVIDSYLRIPTGCAVKDAQQLLLAGDHLITGAEVDQAQLRNRQQIARTDIGAGRKILKRVVACVRAEARETGLLSNLDAAEECLKGTLEAAECIAGKHGWDRFHVRHPLAQRGEPFALPDEADEFRTPFIRLDALLQRLVIEPATRAEPGRKGFFLGRRKIQFHLNRLKHEMKIIWGEFNVKVHGYAMLGHCPGAKALAAASWRRMRNLDLRGNVFTDTPEALLRKRFGNAVQL